MEKSQSESGKNLSPQRSLRWICLSSFLLMLFFSSERLLVNAQAPPVECRDRSVHETLERQTPATCGPPEVYVVHSTILDDYGIPFVPAPQIDITFTGGRITWWGEYAYGTTVKASYDHTPCYATQISMEFSQRMEWVKLIIGNGYSHSVGAPPIPITVTDNFGRSQTADMYGAANVRLEGGGITKVTISTNNHPFRVSDFSFLPECSLTDDENAGPTSCNANVGKPVNVTNGNMYLQQSDYVLPGAGEGIQILRSYNSSSQRIGLFGLGWSTRFDESIKTFGNNYLRWYAADGRATNFTRPSESEPFSPVEGGFQGQVTQNGDGTFNLSFQSGGFHLFSPAGKLLALVDRYNNQTWLAYDAWGNITSITDPFGRTLTATTDSSGRVLSISDALGSIATYSYGSSSELLSATYPDGSKYQFAYTSSPRLVLTSVTDALGNILEAHTYDSRGRALTSEEHGGVNRFTLTYISDTETNVTDALNQTTKYFFGKSKGRNVVTRVEGVCNCGSGSQSETWTYDDQSNLISTTNALGQPTTYTYDGSGKVLTVTDPKGTTEYTYNQFGQVLTATDVMGGITTNTYDTLGNLLSVKDALNNTTSFTYNTPGQLLTVTDARNNITTLTWDTSGRLTQVKANNFTTFGYDARARLTTSTNALNFVTTFAYDAAGRPNKITNPDNSFVTYVYDLAGRRTRVTDALNNSTNFAYDGAYRLITRTDATLKTTTYTYDLMSNLTGTTDPLSRTTNYEYDEFKRLTRTIYPPAVAGGTRLQESVEYDAAGNVTKRIDTAGRSTLFAYDDANRVVTVTDPAFQATQFEYNPRSNVTALVDALNQRYTFDYDALSRPTTTTRAGLTMSYAYDAVGNRISRTDYNNMTTAYTYDPLNRLTKITYPDASVANYGYSKLSQLTTATNINGTVSFVYDSRGRTTSTTDVWGQILNYTYDVNNRRTKLSFGATTNATYTYDAVNRLTKITDSGNSAVTHVYDAASRLTSRTLPNGIATTYTYDGLDRLTRLKDAKGNSGITDNQYSYSSANNITQNTDQSGTHAYGYDVINRLISATYPGTPNESYAYDGVGNRTTSHKSPAYGYQPFNRLVSTNNATYLYNNNGNMISKTDPAGTTLFTWDFENRLTQVVTPSSGSVIYKYDALGRRIQRGPSSGVSTNFIYDGQDVVKDINSDGTVIEYLNGPGIDNKIRQKGSSSTTTYYFSQDHLGSTIALTGTTGKLVERITYDGYGNSVGSTRTRYGYTGRERDGLSGLLYYRARFYDPLLGRFISEDPVGFNGGGMNVYAYVGGNPILYGDPSGLWAPDAHAAIIQQAFEKCLKPFQRQQLIDASGWVDRAAGQLEANAYQHGMRGGPNESYDQARRRAEGFISDHIQKAQAASPKGCATGYENIPWNALWEFGKALHTITDMTSPAHEGFQIWYGPPYPTGIGVVDAYKAAKYAGYVKWHHDQETLEKLGNDTTRLNQIKEKARGAFAKTFGDCGCCGD
jgi:RHS repeat-associated protein